MAPHGAKFQEAEMVGSQERRLEAPLINKRKQWKWRRNLKRVKFILSLRPLCYRVRMHLPNQTGTECDCGHDLL